MSARGGPVSFVKRHWRLLLLVLLLAASLYFLFVPGAPITGVASADDGNSTLTDTNLQFGIDLAGGARITAPVHGHYAEDVGVTDENAGDVVDEVVAATNASRADVYTSAQTDDQDDDFVEVRAEVEREAFVAGMQAAGLDASDGDVQVGVRDETREDVVEVLDRRLGESGFAGGSVTQLHERDPTQVRVESPGEDIDRLEELMQYQGEVEVLAHVPNESAEDGYDRRLLYSNDGVSDWGTAGVDEAGTPGLSVSLRRPAAEEMTRVMQETGFDQPEAWNHRCEGLDPGAGEYCLMTQIDGEIVFSGGVRDGLGEMFQQPADGSDPEFVVDRTYRMQTQNLEQAQDLRLNLIAGELPAPMNIDDASQMFVSPELAEDFRLNSLIVGLLAVVAVVTVVFLRYGDPEVAAPMSATALSEVVILLGFAASIGWPLELSHVAGFIAVIGTGVDDLVIIADEIEQQGDVSSQRVFQSRFRKAFWVIGAAAATTIVAMSPLAILNLGDLRGFAIITILGVLIGVAITRPAYGSILRHLLTGDH